VQLIAICAVVKSKCATEKGYMSTRGMLRLPGVVQL